MNYSTVGPERKPINKNPSVLEALAMLAFSIFIPILGIVLSAYYLSESWNWFIVDFAVPNFKFLVGIVALTRFALLGINTSNEIARAVKDLEGLSQSQTFAYLVIGHLLTPLLGYGSLWLLHFFV